MLHGNVFVSKIVPASSSKTVQFRKISNVCGCTKSYLANRSLSDWSRCSSSLDPGNKCIWSLRTAGEKQVRSLRNLANLHKLWFISKGPGHTGLFCLSRRVASGCGSNQRIRHSTTLVLFVGGLRRSSGKTSWSSLNPETSMNMITCRWNTHIL